MPCEFKEHEYSGTVEVRQSAATERINLLPTIAEIKYQNISRPTQKASQRLIQDDQT